MVVKVVIVNTVILCSLLLDSSRPPPPPGATFAYRFSVNKLINNLILNCLFVREVREDYNCC